MMQRLQPQPPYHRPSGGVQDEGAEGGERLLAGVSFRPLREGDRAEIQALHEALFPVRYSHSFYDCAVRGYMCGSLQPLRSLVAVKEGVGMVGVVIAQLLPTEKCGDSDLVWPEHAYPEVMYILTLGTLPEYRRLGLGKLLLRKAVDSIESPQCGAIYLHVITYNEAAQRFYEANGFRRLRTLPRYYDIGSQRHDAYLYIRHLNRAMDPRAVTLLSGLLRPLVDLARTVAASLAALRAKPRGRNNVGGNGGRPAARTSPSTRIRITQGRGADAAAAAAATAVDPPWSLEDQRQRGEERPQQGPGTFSPLPALRGRKWLGALPRQAPAAPPPPPVPPPRLGHMSSSQEEAASVKGEDLV